MDDLRQCGHGKPLYANPPVRCIECEIVWYKKGQADAQRRVISTTEQIIRLEQELRLVVK